MAKVEYPMGRRQGSEVRGVRAEGPHPERRAGLRLRAPSQSQACGHGCNQCQRQAT